MKTIAALALLATTANAVVRPTWFDGNGLESICGSDQAKGAACVKDSDPVKYKLGKAIARLSLPDGNYCTGFLWGSEGHFLTNHHCYSTQDEVSQSKWEFDAECATCDDPNNNKQLACKGTIAATNATLLWADKGLDFALVKLQPSAGIDLSKWGYLKARAKPASLDEEVWVVGHPAIKPKRFTWLNDDGKSAKIVNPSTPSQCGETDTYGYNADTEGGSSGSPILSQVDNLVISLHNCGGCNATGGQNTGNKLHKIIDFLNEKKLLPKDAVATTSC
ncbi:unnamed protein product [Aphanomyces euteiches]|nr:hypothetical protein AeRB84_002826 [Aphanomyces euteiches]